ncbi:MAG: DUF4345 domain-containing protein [candidate division KSB1 bacterium]
MVKLYLCVAASGLALIALSYGLAPATFLPLVVDIPVTTIDAKHVFRAMMGLYLGMASFWGLAIYSPQFSRAAVISAICFMLGLACGRMLSLLVDGVASPLLLVYLGLEVGMAALGVLVLRRIE